MVSAAAVYVCLYPIWQRCGPWYGQGIAELYVACAELVEHPRRTREVVFDQGGTVIHTMEQGSGFTVKNKNLFVELPIFVALVLCSPGVSWARRLRMMVLGYVPLGLVHFAGFAFALHLAYVQGDLLSHGLRPGLLTLYVVAPLRRAIFSDLILLLPFLVWGALYVMERQRSDRAPGRSHRHRARK